MTSKNYLIRFANELINFRMMEFQALTSLYSLNYSFLEPPSEKPFWLIYTDNESKLKQVFQRSVLAMNLYELWTSTNNFEQFHQEMLKCEFITDNRYANCSFSIQVESFGKKISMEAKVERIERLDFLPFQGPIQLNNPDEIFYYLEYFGMDKLNVPENPYQIMFGRWLAESDRRIVSPFSLKRRKFIANTSMEPILAFLMSNIANVVNNDIVYDPFVGSGSLLVSAAYRGAYVCGTDIDYLLLHGLAKPSRVGMKQRDEDESVMANLKQYQLHSRYLDVIAGDSSLPIIRDDFEFDAIITDPPYGKRESRERIGTAKKNAIIPEKCIANHVPSKLEYNIEDIYKDLLNFSAKHLKLNGYLLFWAPFSKNSDDDDEESRMKRLSQMSFLNQQNGHQSNFETELRYKLKHPQFEFISCAEQILTTRYSRILICMKRIL